MKWASAIGLGRDLETAANEALERLTIESRMVRPDLAIAFVSAAYGPAMERLPRILDAWLGKGMLFGCSAGGLIGGGSEEEEESGVAILAGRLGDVTLTALHLEQATLPPLTATRENWWRLLDLAPESAASFLLLTDPATIDAEACARGIDRAYPGATVVGGLTSGASEQGAARLFADRDIHRSGGLLLALTGNVVIDPVIAQGCRAIGEPLFVTACDGNLLQELLDTTLSLGDWTTARNERANVRFLRGNGVGALADLDAAGQPSTQINRGLYALALGDSTRARAQLAAYRAVADSGRPNYNGQARFAVALGLRDEALIVLERLRSAPDSGGQRCAPNVTCSTSLRTWRLLHDPIFAPLHGDPRFEKLWAETMPKVPWLPANEQGR